MSERAHTKGPWAAREYGDGDSLVIEDGADWRICFMATPGSSPNAMQRIEANARLIAAAPDMFEAGTVVLDYMGLDEFLDNDRIDRNVVWGIRKAELLALRAALAKASPAPTKGEASDEE